MESILELFNVLCAADLLLQILQLSLNMHILKTGIYTAENVFLGDMCLTQMLRSRCNIIFCPRALQLVDWGPIILLYYFKFPLSTPG